MPFESLSCTNCGSGAVQEVKPNTYFCNYCERVFKYVDPGAGIANALLSRARLCACGSGYPVSDVPCQLCQGGVCGTCTVTGATGTLYIMPAPAEGFGYLIDFPAPGTYEGRSTSDLWSITSDRTTQITEGGRIGPFLFTADVLSHVAASLGRVQHELHTLCRS